MKSSERFSRDLSALMSRLTKEVNIKVENKLNLLKDRLIKLQKENIVKINHSVMELVCAKHLVLNDYEVQIEYPLNEILTCDLFSSKGLGNLVVEIETGFIPPDQALFPLTYISARLASKIIRYSSFAGKFALGMPPHYILPLPQALAKPPRRRTEEEITQIKKLCDRYYRNPPVTKDEIWNAKLHEIYLIDVDRTRVQEIDPETYVNRVYDKGLAFNHNL